MNCATKLLTKDPHHDVSVERIISYQHSPRKVNVLLKDSFCPSCHQLAPPMSCTRLLTTAFQATHGKSGLDSAHAQQRGVDLTSCGETSPSASTGKGVLSVLTAYCCMQRACSSIVRVTARSGSGWIRMIVRSALSFDHDRGWGGRVQMRR